MIAGIDLSSKAIDVAIIPLDPDHGDPHLAGVTLRSIALPARGTSEARIHAAAMATATALSPVSGYDVTSVWVEEPWARHMKSAGVLLPIYGAIVAAASMRDRAVAGISSNDWRGTLDLNRRGEKELFVKHARDHILTHGPTELAYGNQLTEHTAEALLVALAGRALTWRAAA